MAANAALRVAPRADAARRAGIAAALAPLALCGDNAAMIGAAAEHLEPLPSRAYLALDAYAGPLSWHNR